MYVFFIRMTRLVSYICVIPMATIIVGIVQSMTSVGHSGSATPTETMLAGVSLMVGYMLFRSTTSPLRERILVWWVQKKVRRIHREMQT